MQIGTVLKELPEEWRARLAGARASIIEVGMSGATVIRFATATATVFLKTADGSGAALLHDEIARTRWLAARGALVPNITAVDESPARSAFLMDAVAGESAETAAIAPAQLVPALAKALAALHALPAADCPFDESIAARLRRARGDLGGIDGSDFAGRNRGIAPAELLARLETNRPSEDLVLLHGDATLSNLLIDERLAVHFIDCGRAGRGDRYVDLAVLADTIGERFGARWRGVFARSYGAVPWDRRKARYFSDLYEFF